jgi:hypothetical protein
MTSGTPSTPDIAGLLGASGIRSHPLQQTNSLRSGAVATTETFEAASLSGYLFEIIFNDLDCSEFRIAFSYKLNTCWQYSVGNSSIIFTATESLITTTKYSDTTCTTKTSEDPVPYTSGSCTPSTLGGQMAVQKMIGPNAAYPFPLSHVQSK